MKPFNVSNEAYKLKDQFLSSDIMKSEVFTMNTSEMESVIRLWISEGIPYAFVDKPMLYEAIRNWLSNQLKVHPKDITLIGSSRTGYSMKSSYFGREFNEMSDLDFSVISQELFDKCSVDFKKWENEFEAGNNKPETEYEIRHWPTIIKKEMPDNLIRGFVDPHRISNKYPTIKSILTANDSLITKLKRTSDSIKIKKSGTRIFKDWNSFFKHQILNMNFAKKEFV